MTSAEKADLTLEQPGPHGWIVVLGAGLNALRQKVDMRPSF